MRGRGGWSGGEAGGRQGVLTPLFPHRRAFPTTGRKIARHLGFPLLSFGRERPERVSTLFPGSTGVVELADTRRANRLVVALPYCFVKRSAPVNPCNHVT